MLLYRPCLCEISIEDESQLSKDFNFLKARECVQAAVKLVGLLPPTPNAAQMLQLFPWASTLHYVCQAGTVLLLEMCLDMQHLQGEQKNVVAASLVKTLEYLRSLAEHSKSAYKAYQIFRVFVEKVARKYRVGVEVFKLGGGDEPKLPRGWTEGDNEVVGELIGVLRRPSSSGGG